MNPNQLIQTWRGPLVGLIAGWGASWGEAHDMAQDALVEAYLGRDRLQGDPSDPAVSGPWLAGIARNLWRASKRRKFRRREVSLSPQDESETGTALLDSLLARDPETEDLRLADLRAGMARLPEKHKSVLYVYYLEDCSLEEAAGILEIPASTLRGRLHTARNALRDLLQITPQTTPQKSPQGFPLAQANDKETEA